MYRVLIIDDDGLDIFMHTKIINVFGFSKDVESVKSGKKGLEYLMSRVETPERLPDIIFLDLTMPIMDGMQFLDAFADLPEVVTGYCKVVVLSATESETTITSALRKANVLDVVPKPLNGQVLKIIDSKVSMLREEWR